MARLVATLCLVLGTACTTPMQASGPVQATGPTQAAGGIGGSYSGRYQCGDWNTLDLTLADQGAGKLSAVFTFALQHGSGTASYALTGQYDERAGTFTLLPSTG